MANQDPNPFTALREQEQRDLFTYAVFRWESAVALAVTLILAVFLPDPFGGALPFWGWWAWIALGAIAVALIAATTVQDPDVRARVASETVRAQFDLTQVGNSEHCQKIEGALDRRQQIEVIVQRTRQKGQRERLQTIADEVSRWIQSMYDLALRLDDEWATAEQVKPADGVVQAAAGKLDVSSQALERTYVQMQLLAAQGVDERRMGQLQNEIADQTQLLQEAIYQVDGVLP
jgi:hypothetical protein